MKLRVILILLISTLVLLVTACGGNPAGGTEAGPSTGEMIVSKETIAALNLDGQLIFLRFVSGTPQLFSMNLSTGELDSIFQPEEGAWITAAAASPVTGKIALAYAPAPGEGQAQTGYTGISLIPMEGMGDPEPFVEAVEGKSLFSFPSWSPDGTSIIFNQFESGPQSTGADIPSIDRQGYPQGDVETLVRLGRWPRLSPDGGSMVYVSSLDSAGSKEAMNVLDLASETAVPVVVSIDPSFEVLDMPMFSPDGRMLYFSAPNPETVEEDDHSSLLEDFLGVGVALAHEVSSDWWRVTVDGGQAERLTDHGYFALYGVFSPNGKHMAFISDSGIYVMNPDGSDLQTLIAGEGFFGTLDWVP